MIRAVIIDDETINIEILEDMLREYCPQVTIEGNARDSSSGRDLICKVRPDLVFLDIEMPFGNAFDLLDQLRPIDFEVIFVTAFDSYMLKAFKYSAMDYLLKPVDIDELAAAVKRVIARKRSGQVNAQQLELVLEALKNPNTTMQKVALPSAEGLVFYDLNDIVRFEANRSYTNIILKSGERQLTSRNIMEYEEMLPGSTFFRIHKSHIVNLNFISKYHKGRGGAVEMEDGTILQVAVRKKDELLARFGHRGT